jgi:hypothetical protein
MLTIATSLRGHELPFASGGLRGISLDGQKFMDCMMASSKSRKERVRRSPSPSLLHDAEHLAHITI